MKKRASFSLKICPVFKDLATHFQPIFKISYFLFHGFYVSCKNVEGFRNINSKEQNIDSKWVK